MATSKNTSCGSNVGSRATPRAASATPHPKTRSRQPRAKSKLNLFIEGLYPSSTFHTQMTLYFRITHLLESLAGERGPEDDVSVSPEAKMAEVRELFQVLVQLMYGEIISAS